MAAATPAVERPAAATRWSGPAGRNRIWWGGGLFVLCLVVYYISQPNRNNVYLHFVLQAQSWLDGNTAIPMPQYQDVMPIYDSTGVPTGYGIIPFPPLPAWFLLIYWFVLQFFGGVFRGRRCLVSDHDPIFCLPLIGHHQFFAPRERTAQSRPSGHTFLGSHAAGR